MDPATNSPLECPATVRAPGMPPANVIVEHVTVSACRLRSVVRFEHGTVLQLDFGVPGRTIPLRGRVVGHVALGPRFIYRLALERLGVEQADALAAAVADWYRHQELANIHAPPEHADESLMRSHKRIATQFPISFRSPHDASKEGRASDISSGGLSMSCSEPLIDGMSIDLRFRLPTDVLEYAPDGTSHAPFPEIAATSRIVWHRVVGYGFYSYGLAFVEIADAARQEIVRYVAAMHEYKNQR